jgi:hypothetical protein
MVLMPGNWSVVGTLTADDFTPGPDEAPIFKVKVGDNYLSFVDAKKWRFVGDG